MENSELPVSSPVYTLDIKRSQDLESYIQEKLKLGHITRSKSSIVSPVLMVPKGDSYRVCVDFRKLNAITRPDSYPLPLLPDIDSMIADSKVFSKIDLSDAFNQIPVLKDYQKYTPFQCCF